MREQEARFNLKRKGQANRLLGIFLVYQDTPTRQLCHLIAIRWREFVHKTPEDSHKLKYSKLKFPKAEFDSENRPPGLRSLETSRCAKQVQGKCKNSESNLNDFLLPAAL